MRQSYHQLLNINDLWYSGNDRNKIEVSVKIPVPAIFRARNRKEFLRNFEPRTEAMSQHKVDYDLITTVEITRCKTTRPL
jgi:hypothetical protein